MKPKDLKLIEDMVVNAHYSPSSRGIICTGKKLKDCPSELCHARYEMLQRLGIRSSQ